MSHHLSFIHANVVTVQNLKTKMPGIIYNKRRLAEIIIVLHQKPSASEPLMCPHVSAYGGNFSAEASLEMSSVLQCPLLFTVQHLQGTIKYSNQCWSD